MVTRPPHSRADIFFPRPGRSLRSDSVQGFLAAPELPRSATVACGYHALSVAGPKLWTLRDNLPAYVRNADLNISKSEDLKT